jgi:hypothetical protein
VKMKTKTRTWGWGISFVITAFSCPASYHLGRGATLASITDHSRSFQRVPYDSKPHSQLTIASIITKKIAKSQVGVLWTVYYGKISPEYCV